MENITKKAYVEKTDGDMAILKIKRECACQNKYSCSTKCFLVREEIITIAVKNNIGAKQGDFVEVESRVSLILIYAAAAFLLPLVVGLAAYFIALKYISGETVPYIISGICFSISIVLLYYILNKIAKGRNDFVIRKIL